MTKTTCPKCGSENFVQRIYSLDKKTGERIEVTGIKPASNLLAVLVIIMFAVPAFAASLWFFSMGSWYGGLLTLLIGFPLATFGAKTIHNNRLLREQERILELTCNYCKTNWRNDGVILESHESETASTSQSASDKQSSDTTSQVSQPTEKLEVVEETKLCPRCHMESNTFVICKECGLFNRGMAIATSGIAVIGTAIGVHGLLTWIAGNGVLWVEIVKTLLCGLPGILITYWVITEIVHITKSREWAKRHEQEMDVLIEFYKKNPGANTAEAGRFANHTDQWVEAMLIEMNTKKEAPAKPV